MTRALTASMQTEVAASLMRPALLIYLETTGSVVCLTTRARDVVWNGNTYLANSWLQEVSDFTEVADIRANNCVITLAGEDPTLVSLALNSFNRSKFAVIYLAMFSSAGAIVADPYQLFQGKFNSVELSDNGERSVVTIDYENDLLRMKDASEYRMTDQSQQARFPGDKGFQYVPQVADWKGFWGKAPKVQFVRKRDIKRN